MSHHLPPLPNLTDLDGLFLKAIQDAPVSNGLAILIGCTKSYKPGQRPLQGVVKDLDSLEGTFKWLMFATLRLDDPQSELIKRVIKHVSRFNNNALQLPPSWRRIVVTFSGHGFSEDDHNYLCAKDGRIDLHVDIVEPLLPQNAEYVAQLSKLFFIDACRGDLRDKGIEIRWPSLGDRVVARGGPIRVSSRGGCLIACSTVRGYQALEDRDSGGIWMQMMCKELTSESNINETVLNIMIQVNREISKRKWKQQPVFECTLNEDVKLLHEARGMYVNLIMQELHTG